jgi:plasmid stabilization system protein ParE
MTTSVVLSERAKQDLRTIIQWMAPKSSVGATRWLKSFDKAIQHVATHGRDCPSAEEAELFDWPLRQHTFKTRRGNPYRLVFITDDAVTTILAIRGTGQNWMERDEFTFED